jgi:tRNA (cytidine/uridine-2'-O-)-methyltransferase
MTGEAGRALHVVLVEPEIHWNTGNIGRTCLAAGAQLHLVRPLGFSLDDRQVRRSGLDYWDRVAPRVWEDFDALADAMPGLGEPFLFSPDGDLEFWDVRYPDRTALLLGRESVGFTRGQKARFPGRLVRIPQAPGSVRSLNLSSCAAVAVYEVLRQRALDGKGSGPAATLARPPRVGETDGA